MMVECTSMAAAAAQQQQQHSSSTAAAAQQQQQQHSTAAAQQQHSSSAAAEQRPHLCSAAMRLAACAIRDLWLLMTWPSSSTAYTQVRPATHSTSARRCSYDITTTLGARA